MAKLPSFQFYPGDWFKDPALRLCSLAAQGVLINVLCFLFESEERGVGVVNGKVVDDDELCYAICGDLSAKPYLAELFSRGVLKRRSDNAVYSSRLVRDEKTRQNKAKAGRKGMRNRWHNKPHNTTHNTSITAPEDEDEVEEEVVRGGLEGVKEIDVRLRREAFVSTTWNIGDQRRLSKLADQFAALGTNSDEISARRRRMVAMWPKADTPESLLKHWGKFAADEPQTSIPGQPSRREQAEMDAEFKRQREATHAR